jgi:phosphatidylinositol-bisphosphatase
VVAFSLKTIESIPFVSVNHQTFMDIRGGDLGQDSDKSSSALDKTKTISKRRKRRKKNHSKKSSNIIHKHPMEKHPDDKEGLSVNDDDIKKSKKKARHRRTTKVKSIEENVTPSSSNHHLKSDKSLRNKTPILRLSSSSNIHDTASNSDEKNATILQKHDNSHEEYVEIHSMKQIPSKKRKTSKGTTTGKTIEHGISNCHRKRKRSSRRKTKQSTKIQHLLEKDDVSKDWDVRSSDAFQKQKKKKNRSKIHSKAKESNQQERHENDSVLIESNLEKDQPIIPSNIETMNSTGKQPALRRKKKKKKKRKSKDAFTTAVDITPSTKEETHENQDHRDGTTHVQNEAVSLEHIPDKSDLNQVDDDSSNIEESHVQKKEEKTSPSLILKDAAVVLEAELALRVEEDERRSMSLDDNLEHTNVVDVSEAEKEEKKEVEETKEGYLDSADVTTSDDDKSNVVMDQKLLEDKDEVIANPEHVASDVNENVAQVSADLQSKSPSDAEESGGDANNIDKNIDSDTIFNVIEREASESEDEKVEPQVSEDSFILEEVTVHEVEIENQGVPQVDNNLETEEFSNSSDGDTPKDIDFKESIHLESNTDDEGEDEVQLNASVDVDTTIEGSSEMNNLQISDGNSDTETKSDSLGTSDFNDIHSSVGVNEQSDGRDKSDGRHDTDTCLSDDKGADEGQNLPDNDSSKVDEANGHTDSEENVENMQVLHTLSDSNQNHSDGSASPSDVDDGNVEYEETLREFSNSKEYDNTAKATKDMDEEDDNSDADDSDENGVEGQSRGVKETSVTAIPPVQNDQETGNSAAGQQEFERGFHDEIQDENDSQDASGRLELEPNEEETLKHSTKVDNSEITVSVVTWNLAELSPSDEEASFIKKFRSSNEKGSDLVLFGYQETENTKPRRNEGSRSREIRRIMIHMLGKKYVPIAMHSLGGVQMALFCKKTLLCDLEHISLADVALGIGNVFHNKGGIGAFVQLRARNPEGISHTNDRAKSVKMLLVVCHLAAHVKKMDARNADYWRLISELESKAPPSFLRPSTNPDLNGGEHLLSSMDHVIIAGDLNYRIDLPREEVEKMVLDMDSSDNDVKDDSSRHRLKLLRHDQLLKTISQGSAFKDMVEGEIKFAPTFKYDKGTNTYDSSHKLRIPAWTDRILFRPFGVRVQEYDCVPEAIHSDHRPVYATLLMKLEGRHVEETMSPMKKKRKRKRSTNAKKP